MADAKTGLVFLFITLRFLGQTYPKSAAMSRNYRMETQIFMFLTIFMLFRYKNR